MNPTTADTETKPEPGKYRIETKTIRHDFTPAEQIGIGKELSLGITRSRLLEDEFKQVKAGYAARQTEADARVQRLSASIEAGFELREARCRVVYRPKDRKKDFFPEDAPEDAAPSLTEDMTQDDFQADLLHAEGRFELREEIALIPRVGNDRGVLVVGRLAGRWYSALRINIGARRIEERLDSEQKAVKRRPDAVKTAATRALSWINETFGKDIAKGFSKFIDDVIEAHKEREE